VYPDDRPREALAEPLLTATDAATSLAVRPSWVYAAVREGRLPHVRVGRHVRFLRSDLASFVAHHHADRLPVRR
jgi:excisionase family DNA binding protein